MKLFTLAMAMTLGLALSVGGQTTTDEQQQQVPPKEKKTEQTTSQPAGPAMGHSEREQPKDSSQPAKTKSGAAMSSTSQSGAAVQTTTVFRNGKQTSERLSLHQSTRTRTDVHFGIGTHPRDWWLHTYSIVLISGCHYFLADDGCWYPAFGFDPGCNFPEGVVYCD